VVAGDRGEHLTARAVTGDELDEKYGPFGMLKVDVEGYEGQVLRGCRRLLARRPALALELHLDQLARFGTTVEEIFGMVAADEYEGTMIRRGDPTVIPFDRAALPKEGIVNVFLKPRPA
jgi:hypothetical protein